MPPFFRFNFSFTYYVIISVLFFHVRGTHPLRHEFLPDHRCATCCPRRCTITMHYHRRATESPLVVFVVVPLWGPLSLPILPRLLYCLHNHLNNTITTIHPPPSNTYPSTIKTITIHFPTTHNKKNLPPLTHAMTQHCAIFVAFFHARIHIVGLPLTHDFALCVL